MARPLLPPLLSLNAGYVDTAGFLALQGLFTAHVTGNFVTLGATAVFGTSGGIAKLLALPMFCLVVASTRLLSYSLPKMGLSVLPTMLAMKLILLAAGSAFAIWLGPFNDGDAWSAMLTGMTLVSAMAIQNAIHRIHLASAPPTTLMTGTTTQIMIDVADLMHGVAPEMRQTILTRMSRMGAAVLAFAIGCAAAALLYGAVSVWCFVVPPLLGMLTVIVQRYRPDETPAPPPAH